MVDAPYGLAAQGVTAREVVQPLPAPQVQRLNRALVELARRPNNVAAMIEAGEAAFGVGDLDAARGFFARVVQFDPANGTAKLGLARVYLQQGLPLDAIPLFNAARTSGVRADAVLTDQALAFDMLGDQASAQAAYLGVLERNPSDNEARRRWAVSQAISGNEAGFYNALGPLLAQGDKAALRARAFGLAILGQPDRAQAIAQGAMPGEMGARMAPYLAYMERLTPAQQAAAANLGIFPRAADIGRDDPRFARFADENAADALLEPRGAPLGASVDAPVSNEANSPVSQPVVQPVPERAAQSTPTPAPTPVPTQTPSASPASAAPAALASVDDAFADISAGAAGDPPALAANGANGPNGGAVDITTIDIPREVEAPPEPVHPRRIWVQVATGRDLDALGFDWRRLVRRAPDLLGDFEPHVTRWGVANRLLAGPVDSDAAARDLINALAGKGIKTFAYTSPEGTQIQSLEK
ncbi:MAG: tetratricopeptide repeat protein [Erythrobacter sp.]|nr:tetratricopeptide repeat protein [Erythrobacter sp.]